MIITTTTMIIIITTIIVIIRPRSSSQLYDKEGRDEYYQIYINKSWLWSCCIVCDEYYLGENNNKKTIITTIDHLQWCLCENVEVEVNVAFHTRALLKKKPHLHRHYGDIISWLIIIIMLSIMIIIMSSKIIIIWSYCDIMVSPHHSCRSSWRNGELSSAAAQGLPDYHDDQFIILSCDHDDHIIMWSWLSCNHDFCLMLYMVGKPQDSLAQAPDFSSQCLHPFRSTASPGVGFLWST